MSGRSKDKACTCKAPFSFTDHPRFVEYLKGQRSKVYTTNQQIRMLRHIAEQSLDWWAELVNDRQGKGTGAARESYTTALQAIETLQRVDSKTVGAAKALEIKANGMRLYELDLGLPQPEAVPDDN